MRQPVQIWLWAYLGPVFFGLAALLCLLSDQTGAYPLLFIALAALPASVIWKEKGLLASGLLFGTTLYLLSADLRLWYGGLAALLFGAAFLSFQTLQKIELPLLAARREGKKGWDQASILDAHLKEVQKDHLQKLSQAEAQIALRDEQLKQIGSLESRRRKALNALRFEAYQQELDQWRRPVPDQRPLKQLRRQFREKDEELHKARRERYEYETRLLELEKRFEEERLNSGQETFWIPPASPLADEGHLEELVGDLLAELRSRCVPVIDRKL